jgi:hypothetical protein
VVGRGEAGCGTDCAIDIGRNAAVAADHVVVVVADPCLEARWRPGRLDTPDQANVNQDAQHVVHGLERNGAHLGPDGLSDGIGCHVGLARDRSQDGQSLARDPVAALTKKVSRVAKHRLDPSGSGAIQ